MHSGRSSDKNVILGLLGQPAYGVGRHPWPPLRTAGRRKSPITATGLDPPAHEDVALKSLSEY